MDINVTDEALAAIARFANGDARAALNLLEFAVGRGADAIPRRACGSSDLPQLEQSIQRRALLYDKGGEEHYNLISALHKSMRNSDPDAAVYWVARMLEAGEDPLYIARRLVRFASEDIGNADPQALTVAVAAKDAAHFIGMPEGQHRARAGGDLSRHRAEEQRGLHRLQRRRRRRAHAGGRAGAAAPAQRADEADEGARLRQGLPVRARRAGCDRRHGLPAAVTGRQDVLRADRAWIREGDQTAARSVEKIKQQRAAAASKPD